MAYGALPCVLIVAIGFLLVLGCLVAAGYFMLRGGPAPESLQAQRQTERNRRMAKALGWRVGLSALLFGLLLLAWNLDWITPHAY